MSKQVENQMAEELSEIIDALNRGERLPRVSAENRDLAEVAGLLSKAGPPPAVVEKLSATLAAEMANRQKRRKLWFFSGTAGTVAASLLVLALNLPPEPVAPQPPLSVPPAGSIVIQTIPEPGTGSGKEAAPPPATGKPQPGETAKAPDQASAASGQTAVGAQPKQAASEDEAPKMAALARRVETKKSGAPEGRPALLVLPGKNADSVTGDMAAGTVRLVYDQGKEGEVTITERSANQPATAQADRQEAAATLKAGGEKPKLNSVTVTISGVEITVEGKQTKEELMAIARSLVAE